MISNTNSINISVVIPTHNKLPRLKLTITSLCKQVESYDNFEVILIDDYSTKEVKRYINQIQVPFRMIYHRNKQQLGRSCSRNIGIELANYEVILFIDDDLILAPGFIAQHAKLQHLSKRIIHGQIMNLPFLRYFSDPSNAQLYSQFDSDTVPKTIIKDCCLTEHDIHYRFEQRVKRQAKLSPLEQIIKELLVSYPGVMDWLSFNGGNTSIPKPWLEDVGLFNEGFGLNWGCEDLELGYRLSKNNYPYYYAESATNYHIVHHRPNFELEHQMNVDYFNKLHRDPLIHIVQKFVNRKLNRQQFIENILAVSQNTSHLVVCNDN